MALPSDEFLLTAFAKAEPLREALQLQPGVATPRALELRVFGE